MILIALGAIALGLSLGVLAFHLLSFVAGLLIKH